MTTEQLRIHKIKTTAFKTAVYIFLAVLFVVCIVPFLIMLMNGTRSSAEINSGISLVPGNFLGENYNMLMNGNDMHAGIPLFNGMLNSAFIAIAAMLLSVYFSSMTAWGFAMYHFKGRNFLFAIILGVIMIPAQLGIIGFYEEIFRMGLIDTYYPLIIPAIAAPVTVFFLRQYILSTVPYELVQAARIDGASEVYTFHMIGMPLMMPGMATMAIFAFIGNWNGYLVPLLLINSEKLYTLPLLIAKLRSTSYAVDYGVVYLGIGISVLPILIAFSFLSRYIIEGISLGGLKE